MIPIAGLQGLLGRIWNNRYAQIDLKNTTLLLVDGTAPTANELEIKIGEGNLTYTENRDIIYTPDRGILDEVRLGDEIPMDVTFDFVWEYLRGSSASGALPTIEDALKNVGNASAWISTDADTCRPYALDIVIQNIPDCGAGSEGDEEYITLADFRYDTLAHDLRAATVAVTGRCNVDEASIVRVTGS